MRNAGHADNACTRAAGRRLQRKAGVTLVWAISDRWQRPVKPQHFADRNGVSNDRVGRRAIVSNDVASIGVDPSDNPSHKGLTHAVIVGRLKPTFRWDRT